jgi:glycerol-3-phosphate dehydrogenase (NAD+)
VIAKMLGTNVVQQKGFDHEIKMWVFEEMVGERKLTELINEKHENVKYLPGVRIPENVKAVPDILDAAKDATILVIVIPHQVLFTYFIYFIVTIFLKKLFIYIYLFIYLFIFSL